MAQKMSKLRGRAKVRKRWLWWGGLATGAVVVIAIVLASLLGGTSGGQDEANSGGSQGRFPIVAYQGGDVLGGSEIDFADLLKRGKPVVLNLWAGLCPPCRQEMPSFQRAYNDLKGEFILVGVDIGPFVGLGSHGDARRFLKEFDITYPTAYAASPDLIREFNVQGMPTTIFFTPDGKVFRKGTGFIPEDTLRKELQALLDASAGASR